ncbi:MAG: hypothetical protein MMC23_007095 [Stictis urceolatum]|nr:hypothetical protein [Stictis urceolata]
MEDHFECGANAPTPAPEPTTSATEVPLTETPTEMSTATATETTSATSTETPSESAIVTPVGTATGAPTSAQRLAARADCQNLLIDDFELQSRLTFLYYNAIFVPSSDDGSMKSVVVGTPAPHRMTMTPRNVESYWYSEFNCVDAVNTFDGISMRIKATAGTTLTIQLQSSSSCSSEENLQTVEQTSSQLGWSFDGTEKLYSIPFSKFKGLEIEQLVNILFTDLTRPVSYGPLAFYCGDTASEYIAATTSEAPTPTSTVPITTETGNALVINTFANQASNNLNFWHGGDDGLNLTWGRNKLTIQTNDTDLAFYSSDAFTVALQQHNSACNDSLAPYPETWDSLKAVRYASATDIYIPLEHFMINRVRVIGFALKGFYTTTPASFTKLEIVKTAPSSMKIPSKLPNGNLIFACTRPNSSAFAIDDGDPSLAQSVLSVIRSSNIKVTFFIVGLPLLDPTTNLTNVYKEMQADRHQIALHSYTHPPLESLPTYADIDWEYDNDLSAVKQALGIDAPRYFCPPFGNEGARMRQRLAAKLWDPYVVNWSVDVEDWRWAETDTPEKQLDAFRRDVAAGGNLVVMHYLYNSTVSYLSEFIQIAREMGKELMRVDQCLEDPDAPPL